MSLHFFSVALELETLPSMFGMSGGLLFRLPSSQSTTALLPRSPGSGTATVSFLAAKTTCLSTTLSRMPSDLATTPTLRAWPWLPEVTSFTLVVTAPMCSQDKLRLRWRPCLSTCKHKELRFLATKMPKVVPVWGTGWQDYLGKPFCLYNYKMNTLSACF